MSQRNFRFNEKDEEMIAKIKETMPFLSSDIDVVRYCFHFVISSGKVVMPIQHEKEEKKKKPEVPEIVNEDMESYKKGKSFCPVKSEHFQKLAVDCGCIEDGSLKQFLIEKYKVIE